MLGKIGIVIALCSALALALDADNTNAPIHFTKLITLPTQPTPHSTTSTSTLPPQTTTEKTTTTTTTTTTTAVPPTPTTPASTTTEHPTSPTTAEPTTTLAPPTKGHFVIKDGNKTCIIAELAIQVKLNETWEFDVPFNATSNGSLCNNETQEQDLVLSWNDEQGKPFSLTFHFSKNDTSKKFVVSEITLGVPLQNHTLNLTEGEPMFTTSLSKSYRCEKEQEIKLADSSNTTRAVLKVSHLQLEAFHISEEEKFSAAEDCAGSSSPDIVPIAVGCALVGLIAIVLIAYLVGRRRSQARGYLSM